MADSPPEGSLLSQFLAGGGNNRRPSKPSGPPKKHPFEPRMYFNPKTKKMEPLPEDSAAIASGLGGVPLMAAESMLNGFKEELAGRGVIKRFGGEEDIIQMDHELLSEATAASASPQAQKDLDLETPEQLNTHYRSWRESRYKENDARIQQGKPPVEGFGKFQIQYNKLSFLSPLKSAKSFAKNNLATGAKDLLEEMNLSTGAYQNVPLFIKSEEAKYLPMFLRDHIEERERFLEQLVKNTPIRDRSTGSYKDLVRALNRVRDLRKKEELDETKDPESRSELVSKVRDHFTKRLQSKVADVVSKYSKNIKGLYGEFSRLDKDPIGYLVNLVTVRPIKYFIKKYILGKTKLFGKLGLKWGTRFPAWLLKQGWLGKAVGYFARGLGFALSKGTRGVIRWGSSQAGKFVARFGLNIGKWAFKGATSAASRAAVRAIGSVLVTTGGPILLVIGGLLAFVFVVVIIFFVILSPALKDLNPPALAAPLDLAISASCTPSSKVSSDQLISCSMSVKANKKADNSFLSATFDTNFTGVGASGECSSVGQTVRCPASSSPNIAEGQVLGNFNFFATTNSNMTEKTVAKVTILVSSSSAQATQQVVFINSGVNCQDSNTPCGWPTNGGLRVYFSETQAALHSDYGKMLGIVNYEGTAFDIFSENNRVCASFDGVVDSVLVPPSPDYPNENHAILLVNKVSGYSARFGHLQTGSVQVRPGQTVSKGQFLGLVGRSGFENYVNIPNHMHYAIYAPGASYSSGRWGGSIGPDPTKFNELMGGNHFDSEGRLLNNVVTEAINC